MNAELLHKVADEIEQHPERYDQTEYLNDEQYDTPPRLTRYQYENVYGTRCCIAGHVVFQGVLAGTRPEIPNLYAAHTPFFDWETEAARDLELTKLVADRLFCGTFRPTIPVPEFLRLLAKENTETGQLELFERYQSRDDGR